MALGDLYFDVLLRDKTDQGINAIKNKLSNLGANIDIQLNKASIPKIDVTASLAIDRNKLIADIQGVLNKEFNLNLSSSIKEQSKSIQKQLNDEANNARKDALNQAKIAIELERKQQIALQGSQKILQMKAKASQTAAMASAKLATEEQRTIIATTRAQIEATKLARQRLALAQATKQASLSNKGMLGSLREMTGLAGKFSAIYMGGQFLSSLIKIRGEFEMQLVSLRAIMQSTERANELYGQLMQLSVISPFQFGDLVKYAKQLSAYQIPMGDLYDTTKRLADLSAGLGVGMDRLILAYGQVRSASVLRGCLGYNTPIKLYNGEIKKVQDIEVGDTLIGDDGTERNVVELIRGKEMMYIVHQNSNGEDYRVNENHILTLYSLNSKELVDIYVKDYLKAPQNYLGVKTEENSKIVGYSISIEQDKVDNYYGFVIDGNKRFQLGDGTITHNTELRQFTEAGIPMVGALADKFSELEGRVVSAGEVFDKISGREVPFEMVKEVLEDLTSEGGMFFETQEKQAQTLQGQISNLKDAYAIMMNEIGQSTDGILKGGVGAIRWSLQNYQELLNILLSVVSAYGAYRIQLGYKTAVMGKDTMATLQNALAEKQLQATKLGQEALTRKLTAQEQYLISTRGRLTQTDYRLMIANGQLNASQIKTLFLTKKITREQFLTLSARAGMTRANRLQIANMTQMQIIGERLKLSLAGVGRAFKTLGATMMASWPMLLIGVITQLIMKFSQLGEAQDEVNKEIAENAKQTLADLESFFNSHKVTIDNIEVGDITEENAKKFVEKAIEKIDQVSPTESLALSLKADILGGDDVTEQAKRAEKALKNVRDVLQDIQSGKFEWEFPDYMTEDNLFEDMADLARDIKKAKEIGFDLSGAKFNYDTQTGDKGSAAFEVYKEAQIAFWKNLPKIQSESLEDQRIAVANFYKALQELANKEGVSKEAMGYIISMYDSWFNKHLEGLDDWSASWTHIMQNMTSEDLNRLREIDGNWSESNTKRAQDIFDKTAKSLNMVYREAAWTAKRISALQAFINVKLNIETGGQLTGLQESLRSNIPLLGNEDSYDRVMGWFKNESDYSKINGIIQNNIASLKETIGNLKTQKVLSQAQQTQLKNAEDDLKTAIETAQNIGVPTTKPTTSKGRSRGRGTTPIDQATLNLKEQYKKYKDLIAEYEKLKKLVGSEKALTTLKSVTDFMPLFMGEGADEYIGKILGDGGKIALIEDYIKKIQGKTSKEAKSFGEELGGALRDAQLEDIIDNLEAELKRIDEALEIDIANFQKWEKIMEQVGNKDIASLLAFGDASKVVNSVVDLRKKYIEDISKETEGVALTYEDLLGMDDDKLKNLHEKVQEAFKETQEAISEEQYETNTKIAEILQNTMPIEEQVAQLEAEKDKLLKAIDEGKGGDAEKAEMRSAVLADYAEKVTELEAKALELLPVWNEIFSAKDGNFKDITRAMDYINEIDKNKVEQGTTPEGKVLYTSQIGGKKIAFTSEELEKLKETYKDLADAMADKNPFKSLNELFDLLGTENDLLSDGEVLELIAEDISTIATLGADATGQLGEMFKAMGAEGAAEAMDWTKQALEGVANIATGFAEGGLVGGIAATFGVVTGFLTSIFEKHDAKLKEQIEESKKVVAELQREREDIERAIERGLGGAYGSTGSNSYTELLEKMKKEQEEYKKQLEDAENIKNDDEREQTIADIEAEMAELDDQIRHFAEDTLKDLMEIDVKDWASQIGDSLVDAFANGEDAATAFDKTVGDLMKNVVKNMASLYILEPLFKELQTYLFGTDGEGGVFGRDKHFSEEDLKGMMPYLDAIKNEGVPAVEELFKGIDTGLGGLLSMSANMEGLSGGIKSITEDTANLLASYLNAVRADVALIAMANPRMTTIAESQLAQLTLIATNTSRSASAVEAINNLLKSVTTTTSTGRVLKV